MLTCLKRLVSFFCLNLFFYTSVNICKTCSIFCRLNHLLLSIAVNEVFFDASKSFIFFDSTILLSNRYEFLYLSLKFYLLLKNSQKFLKSRYFFTKTVFLKTVGLSKFADYFLKNYLK